MTELLTPQDLVSQYEQYSIIDVRSPVEFAKGHIPNATNIALFSDEERAEVGTTYKQKGRQEAIWLGLELVGPKMRKLAEEMYALAQDKPLLIHCWRGGMRSEFMAWLAARVDIKTSWLQGGYKAFRGHLLEHMEQSKTIAILGGKTGAGKTERLLELQEMGEFIIDLEGIANHRGSAFGGLGKEEQPTQQTFENHLGLEWINLPSNKTIWFENESRFIGRRHIPQPLWKQMQDAHTYNLEVPLEARVKRIVQDYGSYPSEQLEGALKHIQKKMQPESQKKALKALQQGETAECFQILLEQYYDKFYEYGLQKRMDKGVSFIPYAQESKEQIRLLLDMRDRITTQA